MLTFLVCKKEEEERWYWTLVDEPPEPQPGQRLEAVDLPSLAYSAESYATKADCEAAVNRIKAEAAHASIKRGYYQGTG